jgi:tetratricopeptide (TPR) repeat protein
VTGPGHPGGPEKPGAAGGAPAGARVPPVAAILLLLALPVVFLYGQTAGFPFVNLDDPDYVYENARVLAGLTLPNVAWAFTTFTVANWHPLTWLSLMADVSLFGAGAGAHHLVNAALHLANVLLLFLGLRRMTGSTWRSAFAAALFAVHPLNVESVAWVSERKNVLSTLFMLLAVGAYARHASRPSFRRYAPVALLLALSLLCKPMAVTLPLLLLLLDFWPLGRIYSASDPVAGSGPLRSRLARLAVEKAPLLALSAASSVVTVVAQAEGGALRTLESVPFALRFSNAIVSYAAYLRKTVFPWPLGPFYPLPAEIPGWKVAAASAILSAATALAIRARRDRPYLLAGWLWYLVSLLPVIGIVQVGVAAMADRYAYVPLIGIFVAVAWGGAEFARGESRRRAAALAAVASLAALSVVAGRQAALWGDAERLYTEVIGVIQQNWLAANNLGMVHESRGDHAKAAERFREAIRIKPGYAPAWNNLGMATDAAGRPVEAIRYYQEALRLDPVLAEAWNNLAVANDRLGLAKDSVGNLREAVRLKPDYPEAWFNLGTAYARLGRRRDAADCYREALRLRPGFAAARAALDAAGRLPAGAR